MTYNEKLRQALKFSTSCLCVGLDPNLARIPASIKKQTAANTGRVLYFLKNVIDVTADYCAAYKPNLGFFEALGGEGLQVFQEIIDYIPPGKIIVADAKRGDISSTAEHYAKAYTETFDVDAVTLNPLMGFETLTPFLNHPGKAVYILTLTSNPGAADFFMRPFAGYSAMAEFIASTLSEIHADQTTHLGMVIGATKANNIKNIIAHHPEASLLIPGIGAQGGSVSQLTEALRNHPGLPLVSSSRSILYAGQGKDNWQQAISDKAKEFQQNLIPITEQYV